MLTRRLRRLPRLVMEQAVDVVRTCRIDPSLAHSSSSAPSGSIPEHHHVESTLHDAISDLRNHNTQSCVDPRTDLI